VVEEEEAGEGEEEAGETDADEMEGGDDVTPTVCCCPTKGRVEDPPRY
jgi:hypothetical protein